MKVRKIFTRASEYVSDLKKIHPVVVELQLIENAGAGKAGATF